MVALGLALTFATVAALIVGILRHRRAALPLYAWAGLAILATAGTLLWQHDYWVSIFFTPIAWTGYILFADGAVRTVRGRSRLHDSPREFFLMAALSIPLWLIFEGYNLRLQNWEYIGMPLSLGLDLLGTGWAFATITPGILETADLVESFGWFGRTKPLQFSRATEARFMIFGALCLVLPLVLPQHVAAYLFALVWVGFVFLLDPMNRRLGLPSLTGDLAAGEPNRFWSLFVAGWTCGWLWEFWNYWAAAKWHYIFPIMQEHKIFEMPALGYLGFLAFALEVFVMYTTARWVLSRIGIEEKLETQSAPRGIAESAEKSGNSKPETGN
jgi:hypothetical protein